MQYPPYGWRILEDTRNMSVEEVVRALGYYPSGRISHTWTGVAKQHELYDQPVYDEAFKEWQRRLVLLFPPPKSTSERLDELETKLDGILVTLGQSSESLQLERWIESWQHRREDNTVIDSQEQNRQQKELNKFLAHRDRQAKTQESKARKAEVEEL